MRIATMARGYQPAPHPVDLTNAPSDIAVAVAEGMSKQGHNVTFFGPTGTHINGARVETANLTPLIRSLEDVTKIASDEAKSAHNILGLWDQYMAHEMFKRAEKGEFDVLHFHHPEAALPVARMYPKVPVIYTVHDPIDANFRQAMEMYRSPNQYYVSISDNQRITAPDLPYAATVHNGIDTDKYAFNAEAGDYLLFSGRIMPDKGVREAIQLAEETDSRLLIIGAVYSNQKDYFDTQVKPHLNDKILYLGFMERDQIVTYYQKAKALLFPIQWEEPFGLTMIEAMSCGTPVIAMRRGSVPEIVVDRHTGFVCSSLIEMRAGLQQIDTINRADCRAHVEAKFSNATMVAGYSRVYSDAVRQVSPVRKAAAPFKRIITTTLSPADKTVLGKVKPPREASRSGYTDARTSGN
jgi:glycosyltransferase involved in cell wall biosynthesis